MKLHNKKGFTLGELLIVVAIIGVLTAIAIPVFTSQLEKSREATDLANVRGAYAQVMAAATADDKNATYNQEPIYSNGVFQALVPLTQTRADWQMKTDKLEVGGVNANTDKGIRWFDEPQPEGYCAVTYEESEVHLYWASGFYDYITPLKAAANSGKGSLCLNSTCSWNGTIKNVTKAIGDATFTKDIKTWAAVHKQKGVNDFNYIISTFSVTDLAVGTQIPAMFCDKDGNYSVGYATVNNAPDKNQQGKDYRVISYDVNGQYAYTYSSSNGTGGALNAEFDSYNLLTDSTSYASRASAQNAYQQLVKQYLKDHPEMREE